LSFYEFGQTIFGCIEGMELFKKFLLFQNILDNSLDLKKISWYGTDISDYFNKLAKIMHSSYKLNISSQVEEIFRKADVFFSKGVTLLYAIDNIKNLFNLISENKISIFDYSLTINNDTEKILGTGKKVKYFNYKKFLKKIDSKNKVMYINKTTSKILYDRNQIRFDAIYINKNISNDFISFLNKIYKQIILKNSAIKNSVNYTGNLDNMLWIPSDEFFIDINKNEH